MIQIYLLKIILSFGFFAETKDFCNEFHASSCSRAVRQAFCEPYGFVPPCSVGALVTLPHVGTVHVCKVHAPDYWNEALKVSHNQANVCNVDNRK